MVNTRHAPACRGLEAGFEQVTYWQCVGDRFVPRTRSEFLDTCQADVPTTFYVHGNTLTHERAVIAGQRVLDDIGRGVTSLRLVLWSWPSEYMPEQTIMGNLTVKAERAVAQGYYLARLVDMIDPRIPLSLAGHSYGTRTVLAGLECLATNRVAGAELRWRAYTGRRRMQAALLAAALDNHELWPEQRYGHALSQVDRMLITVNPRDRTLQAWWLVSSTRSEALGTSGVAEVWRLGQQAEKIYLIMPEEWVGKAHRFSRYSSSPQAAANLRPFVFYTDAPPLDAAG